jgi:hypothetical protein
VTKAFAVFIKLSNAEFCLINPLNKKYVLIQSLVIQKQIQKKQKLNLEKYKGKTAKRYTYVITNYPDTTETVYLNLIIYKNKVIAGDVCSADVNGFIHGIKYIPEVNK